MFNFVFSSSAGKGRMGKMAISVTPDKSGEIHYTPRRAYYHKYRSPRNFFGQIRVAKKSWCPPPKFFFTKFGYQWSRSCSFFKNQQKLCILTRDSQSGIRVWFIRIGFPHLNNRIRMAIIFLKGSYNVFCTGLHKLWQPGRLAARKWRENEKMKRKWREIEEMERQWKEIHSLHFLIFPSFPPSLSISYIKNCLILSQLNTALLSRMSKKMGMFSSQGHLQDMIIQ